LPSSEPASRLYPTTTKPRFCLAGRPEKREYIRQLGVIWEIPDQWEFYVVPVALLPEGQKRIALSKIKGLAVSVRLEQLSDATQQVAVAAQSNDPRKT
jgi:hypothetical protein